MAAPPGDGGERLAVVREDLVLEYLDLEPTLRGWRQRFLSRLGVSTAALSAGVALFFLGQALHSGALLSLGVFGGIFGVLIGTRLPAAYLRLRRLREKVEEVRRLLEESGGVPRPE